MILGITRMYARTNNEQVGDSPLVLNFANLNEMILGPISLMSSHFSYRAESREPFHEGFAGRPIQKNGIHP